MAKNDPNDDHHVNRNSGRFPEGDPRNITLQKSDNPIEPPRSGPAEHKYRDGEAPASANAAEKATGDTNAGHRTDDSSTALGAAGTTADDKRAVGETSPDPAARARADANRPLGS